MRHWVPVMHPVTQVRQRQRSAVQEGLAGAAGLLAGRRARLTVLARDRVPGQRREAQRKKRRPPPGGRAGVAVRPGSGGTERFRNLGNPTRSGSKLPVGQTEQDWISKMVLY